MPCSRTRGGNNRTIEIPHKDIIRSRSITIRFTENSGPGGFPARGVSARRDWTGPDGALAWSGPGPGPRVTRCTRLSTHADHRGCGEGARGSPEVVESERLSKSLKLIRPRTRAGWPVIYDRLASFAFSMRPEWSRSLRRRRKTARATAAEADLMAALSELPGSESPTRCLRSSFCSTAPICLGMNGRGSF